MSVPSASPRPRRGNVTWLRPPGHTSPVEFELDAPPPPEDFYEFEPPYDDEGDR